MQTPSTSEYRLFTTNAPDNSKFITVRFGDASTNDLNISTCYRDIAEILNSESLAVVQERIFGRLTSRKRVLQAREDIFADAGIAGVAPSYLQGAPVHGGDVAGILIRAVPTRRFSPIVVATTPIGGTWHVGDTRFAVLGGIHGKTADNDGADRIEETRRMLRQAEEMLATVGFSFKHVVRTWFYLRDILSWYAQFNTGRSAVYRDWSMMPSAEDPHLKLPASTGIGADNAEGASGILHLIAVDGRHRQVIQLSNPGQKDAFKYGAAFSRGALISVGDGAILELSGTAAIDEAGASIHIGDVARQIDSTIQKIEMLLARQSIELPHLAGGAVFIKEKDYFELWQQAMSKRDLTALPLIPVTADVCRSELLFEIDGEFVRH